MALAHSRLPSMACLCVPHADKPASGDTAKAMSPRPPRITSCDSFGGPIPPACRQTGYEPNPNIR
ncbi:MAG: hypothetical protein U9P07_07255 [Pseudomonadota bacterium]|nr:hypothetical protein [Pseudomonadota bacterium]